MMAAAGGSSTGCQVSPCSQADYLRDTAILTINHIVVTELLCEIKCVCLLLRWEGGDQQGGAEAGTVGFMDVCVGP